MKKSKRKYIPKAQDGNYDLAPIDRPAAGYPTPPDILTGDAQLKIKPYNMPTQGMSFSDWTGIANGLAVGTTVLANAINSQKDFKKEQARYYSELYGTPVENNYTQNSNPIYMKDGGSLTKDMSFKILQAGSIKGNKLTPKQKYFFEKVSQGMTEKEAQESANKKYGAPKAQDGYGNTGDPRKVAQVPEGYNFLRQDGLKKYYRKTTNTELPQATGGSQSNDPIYQKFLINQLSNGVSPEELSKKKYISPEHIADYQKYYNPQEDTVYTEDAPAQQQDAPAQGFMGQGIFDTNKHLAGKFRYITRDSQTQSQSGNLPASSQYVQYTNVDAYGNPTGDMYQIPSSDFSAMTKGKQTKYFTDDQLSQYKMKTGGNVASSQISQIMQQCAAELQQGKKPEAILSELVKSGINKQQGVQIIQQVMSQLQKKGDEQENPNQPEEQPDTMKAGGKWIPKNLHKGRCKNPGSPECPKGSPEYNLAMTFKKHHGFQKAEYGAGIPETQGNSSAKDAWVEAEGGEMYQQPDGQVMKISDNAPSHEEGGVPLQNVDKVLEDTSTSRTDDASKALRITPSNFKAMFGFNTDKTVSHSEALDLVDRYYQKKATKYGGKINASLETLNKYPDNVYANNSLMLNTQAVSSLPTRDHAFNYLFQHQENVKQMMGFDNTAQAAIGWSVDDNNPYNGGNTSQSTKYNLPISIDQLNRKWKQAAGIDGTNMDNKTFQSKIYDWALQNDPEQIRSIWKQWKNTNQGKRLGIGKNYDFNNLSDEQLADLKSAYVDGSLGARTLIPRQNYDIAPIDKPQTGYPAPPDNLNGTPSTDVGTPAPTDNTTPQSPDYKVNPTHPSKFNEPLHWYDLAGPLMTLASASRIPAKYNPVKFNEVRLKLQNPEPALAAGQQQYNQATGLIPTDSQTVLPQLFAAKYAQDNQVLGQYENINSGIKNQEVMYNANVRDRQSSADQQSRATFEQQMLGSLEAERQQKLSAFDDLFNRIALNHKLNRDGNLLMQLAPNYNQYGQYNGNQRYLTTGVNDGIGQQGGVSFKTMYDENGRPYRMAFDAKGRPIANSKMITDQSSIGSTGR